MKRNGRGQAKHLTRKSKPKKNRSPRLSINIQKNEVKENRTTLTVYFEDKSTTNLACNY